MYDLTEENLFVYAAKHYYNPLGVEAEEFQEDLNRFKYVKRLINRYIDSKKLSERLILNHLIVIFNVFGIKASLKILELKLNAEHWPTVRPFLLFLRYIKNSQYGNVKMNQEVIDRLREI